LAANSALRVTRPAGRQLSAHTLGRVTIAMNLRHLLAVIALINLVFASTLVYGIYSAPIVITQQEIDNHREIVDQAKSGPATVPLSRYLEYGKRSLIYGESTLKLQQSFTTALKWALTGNLVSGLVALTGYWVARRRHAA